MGLWVTGNGNITAGSGSTAVFWAVMAKYFYFTGLFCRWSRFIIRSMLAAFTAWIIDMTSPVGLGHDCRWLLVEGFGLPVLQTGAMRPPN
ncbi:hypothetical protein ACT691_19690 [Vibrio metschnikovii]